MGLPAEFSAATEAQIAVAEAAFLESVAPPKELLWKRLETDITAAMAAFFDAFTAQAVLAVERRAASIRSVQTAGDQFLEARALWVHESLIPILRNGYLPGCPFRFRRYESEDSFVFRRDVSEQFKTTERWRAFLRAIANAAPAPTVEDAPVVAAAFAPPPPPSDSNATPTPVAEDASAVGTDFAPPLPQADSNAPTAPMVEDASMVEAEVASPVPPADSNTASEDLSYSFPDGSVKRYARRVNRNIDVLRFRAGFTQEVLATMLNISAQTVYTHTRDGQKAQVPGVRTLKMYADTFSEEMGVTITSEDLTNAIL